MSSDSTTLCPARASSPRRRSSRRAPGCGRRRRLEHAPLRVDDLLPIADLAVQPILVGALDAGLADVRRAGVVAAVDALEIRRADAADVADRVRARLAERIVARQRFLDVDAGEQVPAHGERRRLLLGEVAELHALETAVRADEIAERVWCSDGSTRPSSSSERSVRSRLSICSPIATSSQFGRFSAITRPLRS